MTPCKSCVNKMQQCDQAIDLSDDSSVTAKQKGVQTVKSQPPDGVKDVHLSETLFVPDLAMSLLSVPALVRKKIGVMFLPGKAVFIGLEDDFCILAEAFQDKDGLFYIPDDETDRRAMKSSDKCVSSMVAIAR